MVIVDIYKVIKFVCVQCDIISYGINVVDSYHDKLSLRCKNAFIRHVT